MNGSTSFQRYVRLYTLHHVERLPDLVLVRIRIETLRYSFAPLGGLPLDAAYADDPREGVAMVRAVVLPRLEMLLDAPDPFRQLGLLNEQDARWRQYATARHLPADPVRVPPVVPPPSVPLRASLPARSQTAERIARAQQVLELMQTAANTASTLFAVWQNWQIGRERRALLQAERTLLHNAIQAQIAGQDSALKGALNPDFVRGYLADHGADEADAIVFGDEKPPA